MSSSSSSSSSSTPGATFDPNIAIYVGGGEPPEDYFVEALVKYRDFTSNGVVLQALNETPTACILGLIRDSKAQIWHKAGIIWTLLAESAPFTLNAGTPYLMILVKQGHNFDLYVGAANAVLRTSTRLEESSSSLSSESSSSESSESSTEESSSSSAIPAGPFYPGIYVESHLPTIDCFCAGDLYYLSVVADIATTDCPTCSFSTS